MVIDRKTYLEMCQKCSTLESIAGIVINVPSDLLVKYKNILYYPIGYEIFFNRDGVPIHSGILHDLKANCVVRANFQEINYYE
jgi:hypothetical protein